MKKLLTVLVILLMAVICFAGVDPDNDGVYDNCPNTYNPRQEDVDNDTSGDVCDSDTIWGFISGDNSTNIKVTLYANVCTTIDVYAETLTDDTGYYSFGGLPVGLYIVTPTHNTNIFVPAETYVRCTAEGCSDPTTMLNQ